MANASNSSNILPPISMFTSRSSNSPQTFMPASPPSSGYDKQLNPLPILPKQPLPPSSSSSSHYNHHHTDRQTELLSPPLSSTSTSTYYQKQPSTTASSTSSTSSYTPTTPDQNTLWALFSQFQQQQQQQQQQEQQQKTDAYRYASKEAEPNRRASDPASLNNTPIATSSDRVLTSEEVLAEKRRRNAGASARFRDRRKQRERELQDKCHELEQRSKEFENALRRIDPDHPLLLAKQLQPSSSHSAAAATAASPSSEYNHRRSVTSSSPPPPHSQSSASHSYASDQSTLFDRVSQLEHLMTRFKEEKETDVQKLDELEKENKYLRSLLVPVSLPSAVASSSRRDSASDSDSSAVSHTSANGSTKRKQHSYQDQEHKRLHLSFPSSHQHHSDDK
ncbi:uncharacterized protein ATC70_003173 [Mucor velutinosus]|uniref:BZIP domain-containing protein n=1 Tax=Mucor velutinosus TaxID=708070 RepID=A0AAN7D8J6_9FUNG|nr:hypothetical protein ATC70_003173 [Mucor velutinosus]